MTIRGEMTASILSGLALRASKEILALRIRLERPISWASEEFVRNRIQEKEQYMIECGVALENLLSTN